jgi:hypothetical protein
MNKDKAKEINQQIEFGLDSIDSNKTVEIKLKDLMLIYKTFEEFNRFFHQPMHYSAIEDLETFIGDKEFGAYSIISRIYYNVLCQYLPREIEQLLGEENDPFENPQSPFYQRVQSDQSIDDETQNVTDRKSFVDFARNLLMDYKNDGLNWENNKLENFLEAIGAYANDIDGYYKNMNFESSADVPTWRIFAQILNGAVVYE